MAFFGEKKNVTENNIFHLVETILIRIIYTIQQFHIRQSQPVPSNLLKINTKNKTTKTTTILTALFVIKNCMHELNI